MESDQKQELLQSKVLGLCQRALLVAIPGTGILFLLDIHIMLHLPLSKEQYSGIFIALVLASVFLGFPARKQAAGNRVQWYDYVLAFASFAPGLYIALFYHKALLELGYINPVEVVLGTILILLVLEALRRVAGWILTILPVALIFYAHYTNLFPGFLYGKGTPWPRLVTFLYLDSSSFMYLVSIASTLILAFVIFGNVMFVFRGGQCLTDLALSLGGQFRGGAAKAGIIASGIFGNVSGSAVANLLVTGRMVIPLMLQSGYKRQMAAGMMVVASTGGMVMPPVMGAVAFIMADMTGIPYREIAVAAIIPAILYYATLFIQCDLEAGKMGLAGLSRDQLPRLKPVLQKSWLFAIPLAILVWMLLIVRLYPTTAALYSAFLSLIVMSLLKENRVQFWRQLLAVFEESGRGLLTIGVLLIGAGFMIASIAYSGLGFKISYFLVQEIGGDNIFVLLVASAITTMVLGLALDISASYILIAVLVAPALIAAGISPMASHLFIFYYANLAEISPPLSLTAFIAGPWANCSPLAAGFSAMRLAALIYIVPFLFIYAPTLLLRGPLWAITTDVATSVLAAFALGIVLVGYSFRAVSPVNRLFIAIGAAALLVSITLGFTPVGVLLRIGGGLIVIFHVLSHWKGRRTASSTM